MTVLDRPHVVVINRWSSDYADYAAYIDHQTANVTYIANPQSARYCRELGAAVEVIESTSDLALAREAARQLSRRFGTPDAVVALYEDDQLIAAQLRSDFRCPGPTPEQVRPFRDKLTMLRAARDGGVHVPSFAEAREPRDIVAFAATTGYPVIAKPRSESSSNGIVLVADAADAHQAFDTESAVRSESLIVQEFVPLPIVHIDGVREEGVITHLRASRYINTCLGFRENSATLGSVEADPDDRILPHLARFTSHVLSVLAPDWDTQVFHLEAFLDESTDAPRIRLLEVGARVGGSMIAFLWREVHGQDLMRYAWDVSLGSKPGEEWKHAPQTDAAGPVGGWLLVQNPVEPPCVVNDIHSPINEVDELYAEMVPTVGQVIPKAETFFEHLPARFRFHGTDAASVRAAIEQTAQDFTLRVSR